MIEPCLIIRKEKLAKLVQDDQVETILRAALSFACKATAPDSSVRSCNLGDDVSRQEQGRRLTVLRKRHLVRKIKVGEYMFDPSVVVVVTEKMTDNAFDKLTERLEEKWIELAKQNN